MKCSPIFWIVNFPAATRLRPCLAECRTSRPLPPTTIGAGLLLFIFLLITALLGLPGLSHAGTVQSLASIRDAARSYARTQAQGQQGTVIVDAGRLDPRLRLTTCTQPLATFLPPGSRRLGAITVGVRCTGRAPWTLYVPVTIHVYGHIVVATRTLPHGAILQASDLRIVRRDLSRVAPGYLTQVKQAVGMVLLRPFAPGNPLNESALKPRQLVRRGERVTIIAELNGLVVRSAGTALMNGAYGQLIQVRNARSRRVIDAVVNALGSVKVSM